MSQGQISLFSGSDETLTCISCKKSFTFTVGEQQFFTEKGFVERPKRCKACRQARKIAKLKKEAKNRRQDSN